MSLDNFPLEEITSQRVFEGCGNPKKSTVGCDHLKGPKKCNMEPTNDPQSLVG